MSDPLEGIDAFTWAANGIPEVLIWRPSLEQPCLIQPAIPTAPLTLAPRIGGYLFCYRKGSNA